MGRVEKTLWMVNRVWTAPSSFPLATSSSCSKPSKFSFQNMKGHMGHIAYCLQSWYLSHCLRVELCRFGGWSCILLLHSLAQCMQFRWSKCPHPSTTHLTWRADVGCRLQPPRLHEDDSTLPTLTLVCVLLCNFKSNFGSFCRMDQFLCNSIFFV